MILKIAEVLRRSGREERGFTLIELLIVLAIIGILVAIGIPVYNTTMTNAAQKAHDSNLRMIDSAVQQYLAATGKYPDNADDTSAIEKLTEGEYLDGMPDIPKYLLDDKDEFEGQTTYYLENNKAQPVGDWGGYRDGDS